MGWDLKPLLRTPRSRWIPNPRDPPHEIHPTKSTPRNPPHEIHPTKSTPRNPPHGIPRVAGFASPGSRLAARPRAAVARRCLDPHLYGRVRPEDHRPRPRVQRQGVLPAGRVERARLFHRGRVADHAAGDPAAAATKSPACPPPAAPGVPERRHEAPPDVSHQGGPIAGGRVLPY